MRTFLVFLFGVVLGAAGLAAAGLKMSSRWMVSERASPVGVDATVERLKAAAEAEGWKFLGARKLHESIKQHTGKDVRPVVVVDLCHPEHAHRILEGDEARTVSVFMPCTIAVYEKSDGKAYVASTNAALLGRAFGGVVSEVMGGPVAEAQGRFVDAAVKE